MSVDVEPSFFPAKSTHTNAMLIKARAEPSAKVHAYPCWKKNVRVQSASFWRALQSIPQQRRSGGVMGKKVFVV